MKENGTDKSKLPLKKQVEGLYDLMKAENLEELEINDKDFHIHLKRKGRKSKAAPMMMVQQAAETAAPVQAASTSEVQQNGNGVEGDTLKSPITGVFYRAASPSSPPFTREGDTAAQGKTLCIVEAMKVMNEIKADKGMKILKILVENGKSVTAGQDLFVIEKL
jgi:acetyl-CoA carboxylase biotin carboxyl carrier protein